MHDTSWPPTSIIKASQRSRHCGVEKLLGGHVPGVLVRCQ